MPYGIETDVAMQVSEDAKWPPALKANTICARTQRLYLQPRTEIAVAAS